MNTFNEVFGGVFAICLGVFILTLFFWFLNWIGKKTSKPSILQMKGFLNAERVTVHLGGERRLEGVKLVGITDEKSVKGTLPHDLLNLVVLERDDGTRIMIKPKSISMIEETPMHITSEPR